MENIDILVYIEIGVKGINNPEIQGIYEVLRDNKYPGEAVFYPPDHGGRYEENGTWFGTVTHYKPKL